MATYPVDIPSLPPLASRANDNPAPPITRGELLQDNHVTAARAQHKFRKRLSECNPPLATQDEVVASKRRKHNVESANFVGASVPLWAHNLQQQIIANMQQKMANMQEGLQEQIANMQQQTNQRMDRLQWQVQQESQKSINRSRRSPDEKIEMVVRDDGEMPDEQNPPIWFPNDHDDITLATGVEVSSLLAFYSLDPDGPATEKKIRLRRFLGVIL
jgi:TolA-binding protein